MLVAQVAVSPHSQRATVFVTKPATNGLDIDSAFNTTGREQVPQIVVAEPLDLQPRASSIDCMLAFADSKNVATMLPLSAPWVSGIPRQIVK
jgi:hypothetical protein